MEVMINYDILSDLILIRRHLTNFYDMILANTPSYT